jgi:hypothetical protein
VTVLQDDRSALALQALAEVTDPASVGELVEVTESVPGVRDLVFTCRLPGYVAWRWTVSTAQTGDEPPTVLEVELLPGEGALVAPPWVPWAERLAEYRRTHPDEPEDATEDLDDDEDDDDLDEDLDEVDADALEIDGVEFEDLADDEEEEPAGESSVDGTPADVEEPSRAHAAEQRGDQDAQEPGSA